MKNKKYICNHPKKKLSKYFDRLNNTYYERCLACSKTTYVRKFPEGD